VKILEKSKTFGRWFYIRVNWKKAVSREGRDMNHCELAQENGLGATNRPQSTEGVRLVSRLPGLQDGSRRCTA
jgi:phenylpropionate dioxygenase-like ring-hydroxylating dioxygenase large terminal subunit